MVRLYWRNIYIYNELMNLLSRLYIIYKISCLNIIYSLPWSCITLYYIINSGVFWEKRLRVYSIWNIFRFEELNIGRYLLNDWKLKYY